MKGLTSLTAHESGRTQYNASVQLATDIGDTVKRIDGTEVPLLTPWLGKTAKKPAAKKAAPKAAAKTAEPKAEKKPAAKKPAAKKAAPKAKKAETK